MKKINLSRFTLHIFNRLPVSERRITLATLITATRLFLTPVIVASMLAHFWGMAFFFFVFACLTDVLDGFLARFLNEKTFLGACLDPIADKFLLLSCFATLAFISTPLFSIPPLFVLFVLSKEIIQLAGASILYYRNGYLNIQPTFLGKTTTFLQMIFIMWLFYCYFFHLVPIKMYYIMLGIMTLFISASFVQYVRIGLRILFVGTS